MLVDDTLYATCASGLSQLLADELTALGAAKVNTAGAGVRFSGGLPVAYQACLWSRVANRVLLPIHAGPADSPDLLYSLVQEVDWSKHLSLHGTLAVDFFTANSVITHSQYGALKVKDAVVDQFRERTGERPNVNRETPDVRINVYVFRNKARIAIDLSGASLHRRGYRENAGPAPLKENLAAGLLMASGWPERAERGESFFDPMCGSGTIAIEAALMARRIAPGLNRSYYGFSGWQGHNAELWQQTLSEAKQAVVDCPCIIGGTDKDAHAIALANNNAELAGVADAIDFSTGDLFSSNYSTPQSTGLVLTNPPYGERLSADHSLYKQLGESLSRHFAGWRCAVFTATEAPLRKARLPLSKNLSLKNGSIECELHEGDVPAMSANAVVQLKNESEQNAVPTGSATNHDGIVKIDTQPFVNRLKKNLKKLKSWRSREHVDCWRAYDADLPEFAVAIDVYDCAERHVVVQEYQAPATVNTAIAGARLEALLSEVPAVFEVNADNVHLKVRHKQSGSTQYQKHAANNVIDTVQEHGYRLLVNFSDYLDTGLFLDHRKIRHYIQQQAAGSRFLNLFCYTASASVAAATGGAVETVSVDLSKRYTEWSGRNLHLNHYATESHQVIRSDVSSWLADYKGPPFDLILLDPPTFSNSTDVENDWNLQRDHVTCIHACMAILSREGTLVFSNNYRRFKLAQELVASENDKQTSTQLHYRVEDRTRWSIDTDFQRNTRIHQCWFITHK